MSTPVRELFDLTGKTALVTGGSRGLGLQIAEALGEAGARVMLTSRKAADLEESAGRPAGRAASTRDLDRRRLPASRARSSASPTGRIERLGHVDILVNNAGADLGRAGRGPPARGLGQGDEPQRPRRSS